MLKTLLDGVSQLTDWNSVEYHPAVCKETNDAPPEFTLGKKKKKKKMELSFSV
jgi:hypothetical protein